MAERSKPPLAMYWSRTEGELAIRLDGAPVEDGRLVAATLGLGFLHELQRRGYDLATLRFFIRKAKGIPNG